MQQSNVKLDFVCQKKWNAMTPNGKGRFCDTCKKTVVDFSKIPLNELNTTVTNLSEENDCGNFYAYQLDRPYGNWKDKIIAVYQKTLLNSSDNKLTKPISLLLITLMLIATGCHRRLSGAYATHWSKIDKNKAQTEKEKF